MRKYFAFARIAARQALSQRAQFYGPVAFVGVILGVFSALWRAVGEAGMPLGLDHAAAVWYLAATEWILMSAPQVHLDIEGEIRRGDVACHLARPSSYLAATAAQGLGQLAVRAPVTALAAFTCAFVYTGTTPPASAFARLVPFGLVAMALVYALYVLVGLSAFWIGEVSPLFWIAQKLLFVLGGLMLPLPLYPEWMQRVAHATPFPSMLAGPAGFVIAAAGHDAVRLARDLALWGAALVLVAHVLFRRAVRTLQVNGG